MFHNKVTLKVPRFTSLSEYDRPLDKMSVVYDSGGRFSKVNRFKSK